MCGIAGIHFKKPGSMNGPMLERLVNQLLLGIESRGGDATGIVSVAPGGVKVTMHKEAVTASDFIKHRPSLGDGDLRTVLLHTRFATQGHQSNAANNHPVLHGTTFVTHNGHISNDDDLFREYELQRIAEVDSEAISAMIDNKGLDKVHLALQELQGGFAIAAINPVAFPDQLVLARGNNNPLVFFENHQFIVWASTLEAIKEAWGDTLGTPPRDRKFRQLAAGQIYMFDGAVGESLQFKVKEYTRSTYNYTQWGGHDMNRISADEKNEVCLCGHRRFWHKGLEYTESCMERDDHRVPCSCEVFIEDLAIYSGMAVEKCDSCSEWGQSSDMTSVAENYVLCEECNEAYGQYFNDPAPETEATTLVVTPTEVTRRLQLVPGPESERRKWEPLAEGAELERHNYILAKAADKTGFNTEFVEWILFRSEVEVVDQDAWLQTAHEECDEAYADVEEELNSIEKDLGSEAMTEVLLH